MPIDYSQPGYKEMFANYGLTALSAQALEKTVLLLLAAVNCFEAGKVGKNELYDVLDKHDRKTLGRLIKAVSTKVAFPLDLENDLSNALEKRNYVMHKFFLKDFEIRRIAESPEKLSEELRPIRDLFDNVQSRVDGILETIQKQLEVPKAALDSKARELLKKYQSPN
jgi:hypothetical protein